MIEPQSGHGGASSSGRKANGARLVSCPAAAPTDDGADGPGTRVTGIGPEVGRGTATSGVTFVSGAPSPSGFTCTPIACAGLRDSILVLTDDAVLLAHKSQAQKIKDLVRKLSENPKLKKLV